MESEGHLSTWKCARPLNAEIAARGGGVIGDVNYMDMDGITYVVSHNASGNFRSHETVAEANSSPSTTNLYKRTVTYTVIGVACLTVGNVIAVAIYATQPIRVANLAILIAFVGLVLFINFSSIAYLTITSISQANAKEILASGDQTMT